MTEGVALDSVRLAFGADPGAAVRYGGVALAATLALAVARRHPGRPLLALYLALSRLALLLLALFLLHLPEVRVAGSRALPDRLLILVDDSASMTLPVRPGERTETRRQAAVAALERVLGDTGGFAVRVLDLGDRAVPYRTGRPPRAGLTDIAAGVLDDAGGAEPPDAVLLLSDGRVTKGMPLDALASRAPAPVFAWPAGSPLALSDLAVDALDHESEVFVGEEVPVRVFLRRSNVAVSEVAVRLVDDAGRALDRGVARFAPGSGETELTLRFRPDAPGEVVLGAECDTLPGEDIAANNIRHTVVTVSRRELRALLIATHPRFDALFLRRALESRRGVTLTALCLAEGRLLDVDSGKAADAGTLVRPDVTLIVLDQPDGRALPDALLAAVAERVRAGAGLLVIGGPRFRPDGTPLEALLPVAPPFSYAPVSTPVRLSAAGVAHPVTQLTRSMELTALAFEGMPEFPGRVEAGRLKPGALALAAAAPDGPPLLAIGRAGAGKCAALLVDGLQTALFRPPLLAASRAHTEALLGRLFAHLATADDEKFRLSRAVLSTGEPALVFVDAPAGGVVRLVARDAAGSVAVERSLAVPAGERTLREEFVLPAGGAWTVEATSGGERASTRLFVEPPAEEFRHPNPDVEGLSRLAGRSGGLLLDDGNVRQAARLIPRRNRREPLAASVTLVDFPPVFFLALVLLTLEWGVRKLWRLE